MDHRTDPGDNSNNPEYQRGYRDAAQNAKRDLAAILRIQAVGSTDEDDVLTDRQVREIFAGVHGAMATEAEFGPEPTGNFNVTNLMERRRTT